MTLINEASALIITTLPIDRARMVLRSYVDAGKGNQVASDYFQLPSSDGFTYDFFLGDSTNFYFEV